ncbi:MAG TPA: thioredoxin domain-containing protein [Humisphaera sp.]
MDTATPEKPGSRLAQETSPYLLQHRNNPVDWYPWGTEAFDRARREQKPIFLSVGYSTCYWCHVMERQSFENPEIAALMNRLFVNVKVDREERPDVDQLYMTAVQLISRQGGWPMSVWLTPDRRPFFGGTYYPPADGHGRPGFPRVCQAVDEAWRNRPGEVRESAEHIVGLIRRLGRPSVPEEPVAFDVPDVGGLIDRAVADYEPNFGGFGSAPKFPRQTVLELLLTFLATDWDDAAVRGRTPRAKVRQMTLHALDAMMHGGIRDHLGGGFHRYSTDAKWLVPHFEIMLYDNAMLLGCYAEAHRQTGDARYAQVARDLADFVLREMTSPAGAFYTAFDAEVDHQEGLNYLWTKDEVEEVLGRGGDAERFARAYGLDLGPNFADPHHGSGVPEKNILYVAHPTAGGASPLLDPGLRALRQKLLAERVKRKQPLLDTKVLTSWNALMIRGLAVAGRILNERRYVDAAARAAEFLLKEHRMPDGRLFRTSRDGKAKYAGFLDDYASLAWALTDLADATGDAEWRAEAGRLCDQLLQLFGPDDGEIPTPEGLGGLYFTDRTATDVIVRQQAAQDSPLPSGNAAAALALLALGRREEAGRIVAAFGRNIVEHGEAMASMVQAVMVAVRDGGPFKTRVTDVAAEAAAATAGAVTRPPSPEAEAKSAVRVSAVRTSPEELSVVIDVADGRHVNAHDVGVAGLIPTMVTVDPPEAVAGIDYPPGDPLRAAYATEAIRVYGGRVAVRVRLTASAAVRAVRVRYQPCDDARCMPPVTVEVPVS